MSALALVTVTVTVLAPPSVATSTFTRAAVSMVVSAILVVPKYMLTSTADVKGRNSDEVYDLVREEALALLEARRKELGDERMEEIEAYLLLQIMDVKWKDHLYAMDKLRSGIGLRAYAQKDPKIEYKREGYEAFQSMIDAIKEEVSSLILRVEIAEGQEERRSDIWQVSDESHADMGVFESSGMAEASEAPQISEVPKPFKRTTKKVGRNAPCPCGSGKKYKKCCGT